MWPAPVKLPYVFHYFFRSRWTSSPVCKCSPTSWRCPPPSLSFSQSHSGVLVFFGREIGASAQIIFCPKAPWRLGQATRVRRRKSRVSVPLQERRAQGHKVRTKTSMVLMSFLISCVSQILNLEVSLLQDHQQRFRAEPLLDQGGLRPSMLLCTPNEAATFFWFFLAGIRDKPFAGVWPQVRHRRLHSHHLDRPAEDIRFWRYNFSLPTNIPELTFLISNLKQRFRSASAPSRTTLSTRPTWTSTWWQTTTSTFGR